METIAIGDGKMTTETRRQADAVFDSVITASKVYKPRSADDKRQFFRRLFLGLKIAASTNRGVRYSRRKDHKDPAKRFDAKKQQIIDAAIEAGLVDGEVGSSGQSMPHQSVMVPAPMFAPYADMDPWTFDPSKRIDYVEVRQRGGDDDGETVLIDFDCNDPIAVKSQQRLELVNAINARTEILYRALDVDELAFKREVVQLRPIHYRLFTDDFRTHGRIYTGRYGHQGLNKAERYTITFNGEPSTELDYSGLHPRMLYHRRGIDYTADPYAVSDDEDLNRAARPAVKKAFNALVNAKTRTSALSACNKALVEKGKTGDKLEKAKKLRASLNAVGKKTKFANIIARVLERHDAIGDDFGSDAGMRLMRIDSAIALEVMTTFAKRAIPILGVHDSFIVPKRYESRLRGVMNRAYLRRLGMMPIVS